MRSRKLWQLHFPKDGEANRKKHFVTSNLLPLTISIVQLQINQPKDATVSQVLLLDVFVSLNMFRAPPRPSSGAYNCINPLSAQLNPICHLLALLGAHHILHISRIRVNSLWFWPVDRPDHDQQRCYHQRSNGKTTGC